MRQWVLVCFATTLLSVGCADDDDAIGDGGGASEGDDDDDDDDDDMAGSGAETGESQTPGVELYAGLCAPCHGPEGEGTDLGYELRHPDREHATWVIRNGRPGLEFPDSVMAAYGEANVSDAQLDEIFDWLDEFPQPSNGEGLYLDYCANCHGVDPADGGAVNKEIDGKNLGDVREKTREGEGGTDYGDRLRYMTAFPEERLSEEDLAAIANWIGG